MTLCLHSARDPFRMAGILNEVHNRMSKATETNAVDEWTQNTLYWVADAYFQLNDLVSAEKIYKEFILRAPQSPLVPYALEALAATLSAQGPTRDGEAIIALNQSGSLSAASARAAPADPATGLNRLATIHTLPAASPALARRTM